MDFLSVKLAYRESSYSYINIEAYRDKFDINDYQIKLNSLKALLYISGSKYFPKCILG